MNTSRSRCSIRHGRRTSTNGSDEQHAERDPDPRRVHRAPERARVAARHGPRHLVARPRLEHRAREVVDEHLRDLLAARRPCRRSRRPASGRALQERLPGGARVLALGLRTFAQPRRRSRATCCAGARCARAGRRRRGRAHEAAGDGLLGRRGRRLLPGPAVAVCAPAGAPVASGGEQHREHCDGPPAADGHRGRTLAPQEVADRHRGDVDEAPRVPVGALRRRIDAGHEQHAHRVDAVQRAVAPAAHVRAPPQSGNS